MCRLLHLLQSFLQSEEWYTHVSTCLLIYIACCFCFTANYLQLKKGQSGAQSVLVSGVGERVPPQGRLLPELEPVTTLSHGNNLTITPRLPFLLATMVLQPIPPPTTHLPLQRKQTGKEHNNNSKNNPTHPRPNSSLMNTHIPHSSLPESIKRAASGCRIVYVFRDPKDVLVSCWHFVNKLKPDAVARISLEDAFEQFRRGASPYGSYWDHVLGYWKASIERPDRVFLIRYEDLKKEPLFHTKRLSEFLGHPLVEEEGGESLQAVRKVVDFCSFETLRDLEVNKTGTHSEFERPTIENKMFFRRGEIGDSRNHLTREVMDELDEIARQKWKEFPDLINTISV